MLRGLFTNPTVFDHLSGREGGFAIHAPSGAILPVWRVAALYAEAATPVVIIAGERYGTGSSRDWAAKGAELLGARAVLANSFERIHRANLVCMGILPLRLPEGWWPQQLALRPGDTLEIDAGVPQPHGRVKVTLRRGNAGETLTGTATALLETPREVALLRAGGIIPAILRHALGGVSS